MANGWMHNGFLQVEGDKMSKSLGNFVTIRELLADWPGDVIRLQMLMSPYREPLDWTDTRAAQANLELEDWASVLQSYYRFPNNRQPSAVARVLADDLDTPNAITTLRELYSRAKRGSQDDILEFAACCQLMGFRHLDKPGLFQFGTSGLNVGSARLVENDKHVQQLRAAYANSAAPEIISTIRSSIESTGVSIDLRKDFAITLVGGDRAAIEAKVKELIDLRAAARARKDFKES